MADIALAILTGIFIATVSSWITVNLSLKRYHSERWWDRKANAYVAVIEALHHSKAFYDIHWDEMVEGRTVNEERGQELRIRAREGNDEIQKAIDVGAFILSDRALERLKEYERKERQASGANTWADYLDAGCAATSSCLKDMIEIAKEDLKLEPGMLWWSFRKGNP